MPNSSGPVVKKFFSSPSLCSLVVLVAVASAAAQTFEVPGGAGGGNTGGTAQQKSGGSGLGWGSSIEVGRMARAAEDALRRGNHTAAANFARRAIEAAPNDTKLYFLLGYASRLAGRHSESVAAYRRGLQADPNSVEGLSGLAQTYMRMGRSDEAKRLLLQVIRANPRRANDLLIAGELFIRTGDVQEGLQFLERAEAIQPSAHAELLMATAYLKLKQPARAKQLLDQAKRRDPRNVNIFRAVATFHREEKDYAQAIATLRSAPRMTGEVLGDLGFTYEMAGQQKNAAETYARAAKAEPGQINYHLSAAQAYYRAGDLETARTFMTSAAKLDPDHYRLHAVKAAIARTENRPDEAIREFNLALARMPEDRPEGALYPIQLRLNLGELYRQVGDEAAAKQQMALAEQEINRIQVGGEAKAEFLRVRASIRTNSEDFAGAEADLKEALKLDPENLNASLQYANLLWRTKRGDEARNIYNQVLAKDPKNRFALESMGYLAREAGDAKAAEEFFLKLAEAHPDDHVAYLALGDMYSTSNQFEKGEAAYQKAYSIAPQNPATVANATNAAIEFGKFDLARTWIDRAKGKMNDDPRIMRERARVLFHEGKYLESSVLAQKALQALPRDRNASVYLAYDLYNLGRFDDVLAIATKYEAILPKEPNFPLLAGHVHRQSQLLEQSVEDYTRALERDPNMVEAYVNRGYVLNDLQNAEQAMQDFRAALKLAPRNGVAHLGMAFSQLQLQRSRAALNHLDQAEKLLGESGATHLARATAYRQMRVLDRAEFHYRAALKSSPNDVRLHLALADALYHARKYNQALIALDDASRLSPEDPFIYAQMAHSHAKLGNRAQTFKYIEAAERESGDQMSDVLLHTGDALLTLGDQDAAMERFQRALDAPDANRVDARLAIAKVFVRDGEWEDAKQQVAFAFAESRIGETQPLTADHLVDAANLFLGMHDYPLASQYFERARDMGAGDQEVAIGLANTYLAQGDSANARAALDSLGNSADFEQNYDYMLALGQAYRQEGQHYRALSAFARANSVSADDPEAQRLMLETAGVEGMRIRPNLSVASSIDVTPIFENATIYMMDARMFGVANLPGLMPPPRSGLESRFTTAYRYHSASWPTLVGFAQLRNASGEVSLPSEGLILQRNTYDLIFNTGFAPILRLGGMRVELNAGLQLTFRRDSESGVELNQNLARQFVHLSTSPIFNWLSLRGSAYHESGPFTARDLSSRDLGASIEFTVGRPWGRNAIITGYSARDLNFNPLRREFFTTSTYAGYQRKFGESFTVRAIGEYVRSWRVQDNFYVTAQAMVPRAQAEWRPNPRWKVEGQFAMSRGMGFHAYDNIQSGFLISYTKPFRHLQNDGIGSIPVEYPIRISVGVQQETFTNFTGRGSSNFRPTIRLSLF